MIATCPNCSKRYMLDDALLPKEGRKVRCIACKHVWRQASELSSSLNTPPLLGVPDIAIKMNASSEKQSSWLSWILFLAILLSLICFLIFGQNFIIKVWPQGERFYNIIGLQASLPGAGLSIINTSSQVQQDGSVEMVWLTGDVVNTTDLVRPLSPLKIQSIGEASHPKCLETQQGKECVLDYWEHSFSGNSMLPGEKIHFETEPRPKAEGTQHISVAF